MDEQAAAIPTTTGHLGVRNVPIIVVTAAVVLYVLHEGKLLFAPVLVSVLLAYALEPFVVALTRLRFPRVIAAVVIYLFLALAIASVTRVARAQIVDFLDDLAKTVASARRATGTNDDKTKPTVINRMRQMVSDLHRAIDATSPRPASGVARVRPVSRGFAARDYLMNAGVTLAAFGGRLLMIALLTFLLIVAGDLFKRKLIALAGPRWRDKKITIDVIRTLDRQIERYLLVRLLISVMVGAATGAAMWLLVGLNHAVIWGAIAGILNVLPFVGPAVACALITAAAFLQFHALEPTLVAGGASVIIAALEGNLISPWLTSRAVELNTVAVFVSVFFWGWTWDVWGLALAIPITVAVKAAADHIEPLQPLGELLGP